MEDGRGPGEELCRGRRRPWGDWAGGAIGGSEDGVRGRRESELFSKDLEHRLKEGGRGLGGPLGGKGSEEARRRSFGEGGAAGGR